MKFNFIKYCFLFFCLGSLLIGCDNSHDSETPSENPTLDNASEEGIIILTSGKTILIQDTNFHFEDKDLPLKTLLSKYHKVLFLSFNDKSLLDNVQSGQKVKISYSEILESNPPICKVEKIEVIEN